jgi:hypothetical protein
MTPLVTRLRELSALSSPDRSVVSVYLNTSWTDEHQRERARIFVKDALRRAREEHPQVEPRDLDWIGDQAQALIGQIRFADAHGVALFACGRLGLREILPVRVACEDLFSVSDAPVLGPLAGLVDEAPSALVVFVDGEQARLIPLGHAGADDEVTLAHEVPGRHARGGWAQLAQSRYQRHVEVHRGHHFDAVADALAQLVDTLGMSRIVLAGETRAVGQFCQHLSRDLAGRVATTVAGARHEPAAVLVERAAAALAADEEAREAAAVHDLVTEAAKKGRAVAGLSGVATAASRGAVQVLYLTRGLRRSGSACPACGALAAAAPSACATCGAVTKPVDLAEALVARVVATNGRVEMVEPSAELTVAGGAVARLRYPLPEAG